MTPVRHYLASAAVTWLLAAAAILAVVVAGVVTLDYRDPHRAYIEQVRVDDAITRQADLEQIAHDRQQIWTVQR